MPRKTTAPFLPGLEPKKNPKIDRVARAYVRARDSRMELTRREIETRSELMDAMHEAGEKTYEYGDLKVTIEAKEKIKVTVAGDSEEDDADGEDDD